MMRSILVICFLLSLIKAEDTLLVKQKNALYVQNLIKLEEKISLEYEKYLINELKIPTLENLISDKYLGVNFSTKNILGENISFSDSKKLKIKYAVRKKFDNYVTALYNRDLYRDKTSVYYKEENDAINFNKSYVLIKLQSQEAINIHELLLKNVSTDNDCKDFTPDATDGTYCNYNLRTIRWYNSDSNWIEYDKKSFNLGNVTIKNTSLLNDDKLTEDLSVGSYIYVENGSRYIKLVDNEIKKVD